MFFYASKLISALIWPSSVITMLLVVGAAGVLTGRGGAWSRRALVTGSVLLIACGFGPLGNILLLPLEQRYERGALPSEIQGVIVLGGFEMGAMTQARGQLSFNEAGERLTEGVRLAQRLPKAKLIYTGGEVWMLRSSKSGAAESIGDTFVAFGIARERVVLEEVSRTTWENAENLRSILKPQPGQMFVLVTSAFHMPRAMGTFRAAGFDVTAWPVDYRTAGFTDALKPFATVHNGLQVFDLAFKEWVGLAAYRLSGRSVAFWPEAP